MRRSGGRAGSLAGIAALAWLAAAAVPDTGSAASPAGPSPSGVATVGAESLPEGLSVVALVDDVWQVMLAQDGALAPIGGIEHPRNVSYHHGARRIAWIGADGRLRERALAGGETRTLGRDEGPARYTQPSYSADGKWLLAVELPDGRSRRTVIVGFTLPSGERHHFVRKRTAQFEPDLADARSLHYTTAICVDDCGGMIWELWERDMVSGRQRQLTLMNAIANQPRLGADGRLYFTSNAAEEGFHIWRADPVPGAAPEQLTFGEVRDSDPAPAPDGALYFVRKTREGTALMRLDGDALSRVALDATITDLRDLETGP